MAKDNKLIWNSILDFLSVLSRDQCCTSKQVLIIPFITKSHVRYVIPTSTQCHLHCLKSVRIRSYSGPYFPTFGLNTQRYSESLRTQSECGKMRTRITPNKNTFHAVLVFYNKVNRTVSLQ